MAGAQRSPPVFSMEIGVIIRTSNWIAEEEKLAGIHNCGFDCTWGRGGGLKSCKSRRNAIMKGKLSDKRFATDKKANPTKLKKMKRKRRANSGKDRT